MGDRILSPWLDTAPLLGATLLGAALLGGCQAEQGIDDPDYDGFASEDDCGPDDPLVYPGAPDLPQDGIDSDCDGIDPPYTYIGQWEIESFSAFYSTFEALIPGSTGGVLEILADDSASLLAAGELDPAIAGFPLPVTMDYAGHASAVPGPGNVTLYFDGVVDASVLVESSFAQLDCAVALDGLMDCTGTVKALDSTMRAEATFAPR